VTDSVPSAPTPPPIDGDGPVSRRWWSRALRLIAGAALAVALVLVGLVLALQIPAVSTRLANAALRRIQALPRATMIVREVRGDWIHDLEIRGFRLARGETLLVAIDTLRVQHGPLALLAGRVDIARLDLRGVTVTGDLVDTTARAPAGPPLSVGDLLHGRFYGGPAIRLRQLTLEHGRFIAGAGAAAADTLPRLDDVALALSDATLERGRLALRVDHLALRYGSTKPSGAPVTVVTVVTVVAAGTVRDGRAEVTALDVRSGATQLAGSGAIATGAARGAGIERLELTAEARPLALADLRSFLPGLDVTGDVAGRIALSGSRIDSLSGSVEAGFDGARVGALRFGATRLAAAFEGGRADLTLRTVHEQASVSVTGWVRPLDTLPTYELNATADRLPRHVEGVPAWDDFARRADFATTARVRGEGFVPVRLDLEAGVRGAAGRANLAGWLDTRDGVRWAVRRLTLEGVDVALLAGQPGPSAINGTVTARGQLDAGGRFRVTDGRFSHLAFEASDLSGRFGAEGRGSDARAWLDLDPSLLRGQRVESVQLTLELARGHLVLGGEADSPAGRVQIAAQARPFDATPSYDVQSLHFEGVDAGAWAGMPALTSHLTGTLQVSGRGTTDATGALRLERSTVGQFTLEGADGRFDLAGGRARADLDVRTAGGTATLAGGGDLRGDSTTYTATGAIPFGILAHLLGRDSLETEGALRFAAEGQGADRVMASLTGQGRIEKAQMDSLDIKLHIESNLATLDTLVLISNALEVHGSGRVELADSSAAGESDLHLAFAARDLEPLESILGLDTLGVASATLEGRLHGPATRLVFAATGAIRALAVDGMRLVAADLAADGALDRSRRLDTARAKLDLRGLHGGGARVQDARVDARWDDGQLAFDTNATLDELHRAVLAGTATFDSATTRLTLTKAEAHADTVHWELARPARLAFGRDRALIEDFEAHSARGVVKAHGAVDRRGAQDLDVELRGVGLDFISAWLGRKDLGGLIDGTLALRGSASEPRAQGDLQVTLRAEGKPAGAITSKVDWNGARLDLDGAFTPPTGSPLTLTGHLPLAVTIAAPEPGAPRAPAPVRVFAGDVDLRVRGDRVALASFAPFLDPKQIATPQGTLDVDLRLAGRSDALVGSGRLVVTDGAVELPALGVTYKDAQLKIELEGERVLLREAHVASKDGTLRAEGALKIASLTRVEPDLRVTAKMFEAINTKEMHAIVSGDLTVTGRLMAPVVRGTASIKDSELNLSQAMMEGANAAPEVPLTPADIRMMEETFGPITAKEPDAVLRLYDASDLDLEVQIDRNTWVRQRSAPRLELELAGKVRVKKLPGAEPELFGRIEPVPGHGYVEQFARKFDFTGGEVLLNGPMTSHTANIQTTYKRASSGDSGGDDVIVKLDVTGQVDKLKLTLSSEPTMTPTEIISYIATGQTKAEMAAAQNSSSSASIATQTALAQVTGRVEDAAKDAVGLDVVQIRQDAVQGATLVAGRYMSPQLYVGFRQPVTYQGNDATSTSTNYRTQVEVEYEAYQWLLMNVRGEASEINSFIRVRRAY